MPIPPKCPCVGKHIPKPMELKYYYIFPIEEGGPDTSNNLIWLCPTTHSNIQILWRLYEEFEGMPPWHLVNKYSEFARQIVGRGRELRRRARAAESNKITAGTIPAVITFSNIEREGIDV